jgi:hypothetical protein
MGLGPTRKNENEAWSAGCKGEAVPAMSKGSTGQSQFVDVQADVEPATLKSAICRATVQLCTKRWEGMLRAIVLTGSLARDEATFISQGGRWKLLGDAEFLLVLRGDSPSPLASWIDAHEREIECHLLQGGLTCDVELSPVHTSYLRAMPPEVFAHELRTRGEVVWGDRYILSLIPAFRVSDIPLEDGWRILCNRVVEFLEVMALGMDKPAVPSPDGRYRMIKLYLDLATSLLLFQGAYAPTYRKRAGRLKALADDWEANRRSSFRLRDFTVKAQDSERYLYPFPLRDFAERVAYCTKFKLQEAGGLDAQAAQAGPNGIFSWTELVTYTRGLWRWELQQLMGGREQLPDLELMRTWMQLQPLRRRLRGWASAFRRCGWRRSWQHVQHWLGLGRQASPRYWVYAAACELFFRLPDIVHGNGSSPEVVADLERIRSWLPIPGRGSEPQGNPGWRELAADIAANYRTLLKGTRS